MRFFRLRKLLKRPAVQAALAWSVAVYIRLVVRSCRISWEAHPAAEPYLRGERQGIFAFWHGRMLLVPAFGPPGRKMCALISAHRDGRMISRVLTHFGVATVTGSSSRGGAAAMRLIFRCLKAGDNLSVTPDGPRGPACIAAPGVVQIAGRSGLPIVPVAISASRARYLASWDRFQLPLPLGQVGVAAGAPIFVTGAGDEQTGEANRLALQDALNAVMETADRLAGVVP